MSGLKRFRSKNQDGGFLGGLGKRKTAAKIMLMNGKVHQPKMLIKKISKTAPPAIVGKFKNGHMALSCIVVKNDPRSDLFGFKDGFFV